MRLLNQNSAKQTPLLHMVLFNGISYTLVKNIAMWGLTFLCTNERKLNICFHTHYTVCWDVSQVLAVSHLNQFTSHLFYTMCYPDYFMACLEDKSNFKRDIKSKILLVEAICRAILQYRSKKVMPLHQSCSKMQQYPLKRHFYSVFLLLPLKTNNIVVCHV